MEYNKCDEQHIISMLAAERKHAKSNWPHGPLNSARWLKTKHSGR
jgi:hypothetical protein